MYDLLGRSFGVEINFRNACVAISCIEINHAGNIQTKTNLVLIKKKNSTVRDLHLGYFYPFSHSIHRRDGNENNCIFPRSLDHTTPEYTVWSSSVQNNHLDTLHGKIYV